MRRVLAVMWGLTAMGSGVQLLMQQSAHNAACNASSGRGAHLASICQHIVYSYLGAFGLVGAGLIAVMFGATVMKRQNMRGGRRRKQLTKVQLRS